MAGFAMMLEGVDCPEGMTDHILPDSRSLNAYRTIQDVRLPRRSPMESRALNGPFCFLPSELHAIALLDSPVIPRVETPANQPMN